MSLLVTGGLGFVGSHFVRVATEAGAAIVVLDDGSGGEAAKLPDGVRVVRGDIGDVDLVARVVREERVDGAVCFAGLIQVGESMRLPERYFDVNVSRSLRLLETLRRAQVERVVFSSTAAVYGTPAAPEPIVESSVKAPINPYGATKLTFEFALEAYGRAHGLKWAALRYFNAAGAHPSGELREAHDPETHLLPLAIDAALGRRPPLTLFGDDYPTPDGTCVRDYIHVCDLATAHLAALDRLTRATVGAVNLGTGAGYSVRQVVDAVGSVVAPVPHATAARREGDPPVLVACADRARDLLGWTPTRSDLATIIEDCARSRR